MEPSREVPTSEVCNKGCRKTWREPELLSPQKAAEEGGLKVTPFCACPSETSENWRQSEQIDTQGPRGGGSGLDLRVWRSGHSPHPPSILRCQCNGHADTCNEQDGTGCPCQNNTETGTCQGSSPSDRRDCYKYQVCLEIQLLDSVPQEQMAELG